MKKQAAKKKKRLKGVVDHISVETYGDDEWITTEPFEWYGIIVPKGFITDFASIPRFMRWYINPVGKIRPAALVHDYLYSRIGCVTIDGIKEVFTRKDCDDEFLEIMREIGMKYLKRNIAYRGVRVGGWKGWNRRRKELGGIK